TTVAPRFSDKSSQLRLPLPFRIAPFALLLMGTLAVRLIRASGSPTQAAVGDTTPDSCWFLGKVYFNRADPSLFVEKRMGLGYTLNLGNPVSWLVMIVAVTALSIPFLLAP